MDWLAWLRRGWVRLGGAMSLLLRVAVVVLLLDGVTARAQAGSQTVEEALHRMSDRAAVVFVGQVVAVRRVAVRKPISPKQSPFIRVSIRVLPLRTSALPRAIR